MGRGWGLSTPWLGLLLLALLDLPRAVAGAEGNDGDAGGVAWGYDDWFECYYDHCTVDETATVGCHDDAFCCVAPGDARVPICLCMPNHFGDGVESCERCPGGWSSTSPAGARALTDCVARDVDAGYGYYDDDDDGCNVPASYFLLILIFVGVSMLACVWCPFLFERREEANFADYFVTCVVSVFGCSFSGIPALAMSLACGPATAVLYFLFITAICTGCWFWRKKKQPTEQGPPPAQRAVAQAEPIHPHSQQSLQQATGLVGMASSEQIQMSMSQIDFSGMPSATATPIDAPPLAAVSIVLLPHDGLPVQAHTAPIVQVEAVPVNP